MEFYVKSLDDLYRRGGVNCVFLGVVSTNCKPIKNNIFQLENHDYLGFTHGV